jgi:hypothetical protein
MMLNFRLNYMSELRLSRPMRSANFNFLPGVLTDFGPLSAGKSAVLEMTRECLLCTILFLERCLLELCSVSPF